MHIPIYTLLPYKEAVIDNLIQNEIICIRRNDLLVIVKTSQMVHTLLPFVECTIMTVVITLLCIIYITIV